MNDVIMNLIFFSNLVHLEMDNTKQNKNKNKKRRTDGNHRERRKLDKLAEISGYKIYCICDVQTRAPLLLLSKCFDVDVDARYDDRPAIRRRLEFHIFDPIFPHLSLFTHFMKIINRYLIKFDH